MRSLAGPEARSGRRVMTLGVSKLGNCGGSGRKVGHEQGQARDDGLAGDDGFGVDLEAQHGVGGLGQCGRSSEGEQEEERADHRGAGGVEWGWEAGARKVVSA